MAMLATGTSFEELPSESQACRTRCPRCGQHFSPDGRFCPFDGEPLVRATDWDPSGDPWLDRVIENRYHVEAVIGEGGMGTVYRVRHVLLGKHLALKALRADLTNDEEIAARFIHEARTAASLSHPGLVQISDFGRLPSGQAYLVMELLDGVPLSALLRRYGAFAPLRAFQIVRQLAVALAFTHDAGVIHRDLKPDNVHVRTTSRGDDIKVVDFGLARVVGSSRLTRKGMVFGTPHYMSPEQASGLPSDGRSDLYSLGILLYELLVGRVPFEAETYRGVLTQHLYLKPVPPSERLGKSEGVETLERVALRCLEKDPAKRYGSMKELIRALDAIPRATLGTEPPGVIVAPLPVGFDGDTGESEALSLLPKKRGAQVLLGLSLLGCAALGALLVREFAPQEEPVAPRGRQAQVTVPAVKRPQSEVPAAPKQSLDTTAEPRAPLARISAAQATRKVRAGVEPRPSANSTTASAPSASSATDLIDPWARKASSRAEVGPSP